MEFEVVYGIRKGKKFATAQDAVIFAREKAKDIGSGLVVPVWYGGVAIAVVTDDANGLTVHRLATWPEDEDCAYE